MLQDCKYKLPCNWCDKYDRMCEAVLMEIELERKLKNERNAECKHEWFCEEVWHFPNDFGEQINRARFVCRLCGEKYTTNI